VTGSFSAPAWERPRASAGGPRRGGFGAAAVLGDLLITLGVLLVLYVVYQLWWTNITAGRQVARNSAVLQHQLAANPGGAAAAPPATFPSGQSFAFIYIPAFGPGWRALVMQGVDRETVLNTGAVGHYSGPGTSFPWDASGNFALAGHRDGHGMIFRDLDQLKPGDKVYVQTQYGWYVYQLDREAPSVPIADVGAIEPIPVGSGYTTAGHYITLTTCTPIYIDTSRLVWWGHLVETTRANQVPTGVTPVQ
jgi:sortase A